MNEKYFCMCPVPRHAHGLERAASLNAYKWTTAAIIPIAFLHGDASLRAGRSGGAGMDWPKHGQPGP
jgi:hypothetical protein